MDLYTGASVTIIPSLIWSDVLVAKFWQQTEGKLKSYSGMREIPVVGEAKAQVSCGDQKACLPVVVTAAEGPALMGRNRLSRVHLTGDR